MGLFVGFIFGLFSFWLFHSLRLSHAHHKALLIIQDAEKNSEKLKAALLLEIQQKKQAFELSVQQETFSLQQQKSEVKAQQKKMTLELERIKKEDRSLLIEQKEVQAQKKEAQELVNQACAKLESISKLSHEEARADLMRRVESELQASFQERREYLARALEEESRQYARNLLFLAVERKDSFITKESFVTEVMLPDQKFIPRLIGKEGRNIQTLEELLHVVLIIGEDPPLLRISSFDPKARAIARAVVERLIVEEKVTPVTVRSAHQAVVEAFSNDLILRGKNACRRAHLPDSFPEDLLSTLGSLAFRSSYGQNVLEHSIEVSQLMGMVARELGIPGETAPLLGLFHDIGKGLSFSSGESHSSAGKRFGEKNGLSATVVNGIASHHGEEEPSTEEARLLRVCDALSARLPGARDEHEPHFLQVATQCEGFVRKIDGVQTAWAHVGPLYLDVVVRPSHTRPSNEIAEEIQTNCRLIPLLKLPVRVSFI